MQIFSRISTFFPKFLFEKLEKNAQLVLQCHTQLGNARVQVARCCPC